MPPRTNTITPPARTLQPGHAPYLFLVLSCDDPLRPAARFCLGGMSIVRLLRDEQPRVERRRESSCHALNITLTDPWMSGRHAVLTEIARRWTLGDHNSKNGTILNGRRLTTTEELHDGDVIEVGRSVLVFRESLPADDPTAGDILAIAAPDGMARPLTLLPGLEAKLERLRAVAAGSASILIHGATGTGKEGTARAIHEWSGRKGEFVAVNCGAIPQGLVEATLFGHLRGAFTGADSDAEGLIASAHRGTLFLDELGDLPRPSQAALLRVLDEGMVMPVGGRRSKPVDVRVVSATNHDLEAQMRQGTFRVDLLARLAGFVIELPPLRERIVDLGLLMGALLRRHDAGSAVGPVGITPEAARALLRHPWPLNIRELEKALMVALSLARGRMIELGDLPRSVQESAQAEGAPAGAATPTEDRSTPPDRRAQLVALLERHRGNLAAVAYGMGCSRTQIYRLIRDHGIDLAAFRR